MTRNEFYNDPSDAGDVVWCEICKPINELWDKILAYEIATENELKLITSINGYTKDALNSVVYVRTGYQTLDQYIISEETESYEYIKDEFEFLTSAD